MIHIPDILMDPITDIISADLTLIFTDCADGLICGIGDDLGWFEFFTSAISCDDHNPEMDL